MLIIATEMFAEEWMFKIENCSNINLSLVWLLLFILHVLPIFSSIFSILQDTIYLT